MNFSYDFYRCAIEAKSQSYLIFNVAFIGKMKAFKFINKKKRKLEVQRLFE